MPPWHADPAYGTWANDRRLTDVERDTLVRWVEAGRARGTGPRPTASAARPASTRARARGGWASPTWW